MAVLQPLGKTSGSTASLTRRRTLCARPPRIASSRRSDDSGSRSCRQPRCRSKIPRLGSSPISRVRPFFEIDWDGRRWASEKDRFTRRSESCSRWATCLQLGSRTACNEPQRIDGYRASDHASLVRVFSDSRLRGDLVKAEGGRPKSRVSTDHVRSRRSSTLARRLVSSDSAKISL